MRNKEKEEKKKKQKKKQKKKRDYIGERMDAGDWILSLIVLMVIGGMIYCLMTTFDRESSKELISEGVEKEMILYPGKIIKSRPNKLRESVNYRFDGYIDNERFVMQRIISDEGSLYYPATEGFKFKLEDIDSIEFEVMEVNLDENYIKLKTHTKK